MINLWALVLWEHKEIFLHSQMSKKKCVKKLNLVINWHEIVEILNLTPYKTVVDYGVFEDAIKNAKDNEVLSQNMTLTIARWIHNELVFMSSFWS